LKRLKIEPSSYLKLIYELTEDLTRKSGNVEHKIRNVNNLEFIKTTQILTEYGICYTTNNILAVNLSTSLLLDGKIPFDDVFYKKEKLHEVRYGNLFDGEVTYSFIGFKTPITIFMHSPYETMNVARAIGYTKDAYEFETLSQEIITTKDIKETFISQRGCRFHWESNLTHYRVYSKNLCMSECRLELAYAHCGCIPHFYSNKGCACIPARLVIACGIDFLSFNCSWKTHL
jgi:amiloride-sensitive sodium channel